MKKKIVFIALSLITLLCQINVCAAEYAVRRVCYWREENDAPALAYSELGFCGYFSEEQIAEVLFTNLIERKEALGVLIMPDNVSLISIRIVEDTLHINVSAEFLNYGGNEFEALLLDEISRTAAELKGVDKLCLYVDYAVAELIEGRRSMNINIREYIIHETE